MARWQTVYQDELEYRVSIVHDVLKDREIDAQVLTMKDYAHGFGHFEVRVPADQVLLAIRIIEKYIQF